MTEAVTLCRGQPRFDPPLSPDAAMPDAALAAWRERLERLGPRAAAASVRGDFAIGLRDEQGRTFLCVDRFAVRSLCWRQVGDELRFAERADVLADADTPIDAQAIYDYLYFHVIPSPRTIYRGIHRLPPGHYAWFDRGQLTIAPYWVPEFDASAGRAPSFAAARAEFRELLQRAVRRQIDGGTPACFLSGGTDSSTIAGIICQVAGRPAATYSIGFEAEGYDEMEFARTTARHFGTEHHEYYVTPEDLVSSMAHVAAAYDQPFGNSSVLPVFYCARMAQGDGVTRLLAGDGGDELFGGNSRYAKERVFGLYDQVPGSLRRGLLEPALAGAWVERVPGLKKGKSYIEQARMPMPDRMQMYNLLRRLGPDQVFTPQMRRAVDEEAPLRAQREVWAVPQLATALDRQLAFDWRYTLAECDLPKVCGATALAGVGVGFPLLDQELVDFSMRLPASYKLRGLQLRWFFKEALRGFLPDATIAKKKQGFGLPFGVWATRHAGLRRLAADALHSLGERGIVDAEFMRRLIDEQLPAHPGYYGEMIWILTMLELWLQAHAPRWRMGG
jgi:asparagine synthase (glutamine-hydrolysing)